MPIRASSRSTSSCRRCRPTRAVPLPLSKARYQAEGVLFIPDEARFATLLWLPEGADIGKAINDAMRAIETENEELKDVLPKTYNRLENSLLVSLLKNLSSIPTMDGDAFGKIYEYFLGKFAMSEGQKGGEFFTPISIVRLIVEIIEPFQGRILDPACGLGWYVRAERRFREKPPARTRQGTQCLWPGENLGDGAAGADELGRPRAVRRHQAGQYVLPRICTTSAVSSIS